MWSTEVVKVSHLSRFRAAVGLPVPVMRHQEAQRSTAGLLFKYTCNPPARRGVADVTSFLSRLPSHIPLTLCRTIQPLLHNLLSLFSGE